MHVSVMVSSRRPEGGAAREGVVSMKRIALVLYASLSYLAFLLPIGYMVAFLADAGVPKTVDRGAGPLGPALAVDVMLLLVFAVQHSVMARPAFKRLVRRWIPPSTERGTYVLASGLVLTLLLWLWRPIPAVLWDVNGTPLEALAWTGFATGWAAAVAATFALSHLHLFGVAQIVARLRGVEHPRLGLRTPLLYQIVRHPMTAGLLLAFWSTPRMTVGHLLFTLGMTLYCLGATVLEERDLLAAFPEGYREYRRRVPALVPFLRPGLLAPGSGRLRWELSVLGVGVAALCALSLHGTAALGEAAEGSGDGAQEPVPEEQVLDVDGTRRTYRLFAPSTSDPGPRPMILALHGTGGDAHRFRGFLGGELERMAGDRGWIVAYPEAWRGAWNDCRREARPAARAAGVDDVAFLEVLIASLAAEHTGDPERVFLLGYSGGGHMAFRVALEAPDVVRGAAVFGANLPADEASVCRPRVGTPSIMVVNGTRDPINPFDGGTVIGPTGARLGLVRSSSETVAYFRAAAGRSGARVELVRVEGGGHAVPGAASRFPRLVGSTVRSWEGVSAAVEFFAGL